MKVRSFLIILLILSSSATRAQWQRMIPIWGSKGQGYFVASFAATNSGLMASSTDSGIHRSTDDGVTWQPFNRGLKTANSQSVYKVRQTAGGVFAATNQGPFRLSEGDAWYMPDTSWKYSASTDIIALGNMLYAAGNNGPWKSTDWGASWSFCGDGVDNLVDYGLATIGDTLFTGAGAGVYRSIDEAFTWDLLDTGISPRATCNMIALGHALFVESNGLFLSMDAGNTWALLDTSLEVITRSIGDLAMYQNYLFVTSEKGVFVTGDLGQTWANITANLYKVGAIGVYDGYLFTAGVDSANSVGSIWRRPLSEVIPTGRVQGSSNSDASLSIYPNPCSSQTTIEYSGEPSDSVSIAVTDLLGNCVFNGNLGEGEHTLTFHVGALPAGIYECVVRSGDRVRHSLLVVSK